MMAKGMVVRSVAGHDKDHFYVVLDLGPGHAMIADGKMRKIEKPKRKNLKHLKVTKSFLDLNGITSNRSLRILLSPFNQQGTAADNQEGRS